MPRHVTLREDVKLAGPGSVGVLLGDRVREYGLDPEAYCAVIPGECGAAGKININGRIYQVNEAVVEHERLCEEAGRAPNFGERDHPQKGPSWNVLTRFLGGRTEIQEDGSARFFGDFAVINSSLGRDMIANWRAGVPVGVSLRARGLLEEHVIDGISPYAKMNPGAMGRKVQVVSEVEFKGYDWVRVASADTYLPPPEVTEAFKRLAEAVEADPEEDAVFKTWDDFLKAHPESAAKLKAEAEAGARKPLEESVSSQTAELTKVKDELREANAAKAGLTESVQELVAWKRDSEKELKAARLKSDVVEAVDKFIVGRRAGAVIKANVLEELLEGRIDTVEIALKRADKFSSIAEAAGGSSTTGGAGGEKKDVHEASDGGAGSAGAPKPAGAASKLKLLQAGQG